MLPNLRLVLAAVGLTILVVLKLGSDLITSGPMVTAGVIDRPEVRRHVFLMPVPNSPDWRTFDSLARARRSDELHRLLDLPGVTVSSYADVDQGAAETTGANKPSAAFPFEPVPLPSRRPVVAAVGDVPEDLSEPSGSLAATSPASEPEPVHAAVSAATPDALDAAPADLAPAGVEPEVSAPADARAGEAPLREVRAPEAAAPFSIEAQGLAGMTPPVAVPPAELAVTEASRAAVEPPRRRTARPSRSASRRTTAANSQGDKPTPVPLILNPLSETFP